MTDAKQEDSQSRLKVKAGGGVHACGVQIVRESTSSQHVPSPTPAGRACLDGGVRAEAAEEAEEAAAVTAAALEAGKAVAPAPRRTA